VRICIVPLTVPVDPNRELDENELEEALESGNLYRVYEARGGLSFTVSPPPPGRGGGGAPGTVTILAVIKDRSPENLTDAEVRKIVDLYVVSERL
jgi:hypothetical protein